MEPEVRLATDGDAGQVRALVNEAYCVYVERMGRQPAPMDADYDTLIGAGHVWIAVGAEGLLGLIVLEPRADHLFIENIAVSPRCRGRGLGSELLAFAEARARAAGLGELRLYTNALMFENLSYYPRRGFVETHRARSSGFDRVFFAKTLDGAGTIRWK